MSQTSVLPCQKGCAPRSGLRAKCTLLNGERLSQEAGPAAFEPYQGLLHLTEDFRVYGYISCTRVKFLITVDDMVRV